MFRFFWLAAWATISLFAAQAWAQETQPTTWLVVRHADRAGEGDAITPAGEERAKQLAGLAKVLRVNAVYSTDFERTRKTAEPTAEALNLKIATYETLDDALFNELKHRHAGEVVLIVGHSNTVGKIVNGLGVEGDFPIAENEFDSLFVVATSDSGSSVLRLKYGERPVSTGREK